MKKLIRPLVLTTAISVGALAGTDYLLADEKPAKLTAKDTRRLLDDKPVRGGFDRDALSDDAIWGLIRFNMWDEKPVVPGAPGGNANPMGDSKADKTVQPVKITDAIAKTDFAVKPKELSAAVKKGLEYLVKGQQEDGGWNQGGGWRNNTGGGRVEGKTIEDPSDIGNTCFVLLALLRGGNSATEGPYKDAVKKGLKYVIGRVEKADKDSLYVTDVKGTQLQSKIGQYVDTFLVNLVLAEYRGKSGDQEKQLVAALEKTMTKIVRHQTADGGFAGNAGWAPTLSVGIANKGLVRARERGAEVDDKALERVMAQAKGAATGTAPAAVPADSKAPVAAARPLAGSAGDAGVALYRASQGAGNTQDFLNTLRVDGAKARDVLKDSKATKEAREMATKKLGQLDKAESDNDRIQGELAKNVRNESFVAGFGNNGGEEFLSFMNISETLVLIGGKDWDEWDAKMVKGLEKAQDKDGSWQGHHCITGKTFCTSGALLVLMADRTPFPVEVIKAAREKREKKSAPTPEKK
jgi:Prenyltransferase and squalene oxidase repeat